jgi:hypothetical protein
MKLMTAAELGSTGVEEMSAFQRLSAGNGTKPPRLAPWPSDRELQLEVCGGGGGGGRLPMVVAPQPTSESARNATLKLSILRMFAGVPGAMYSTVSLQDGSVRSYWTEGQK